MKEETDVAKNNNSKECMVCRYWYFNNGFKFPKSDCNGCHDELILCLNLRDIAIITVKSIDYHCVIHDISKSDAINLLESFVLNDRGYI